MKRPTISCVFFYCLSAARRSRTRRRRPPKTPITHETLWMMKRVGAPLVSPNGKWVVYPVAEPSYDKDQSVSDLWLVSADGQTAPRRITNARAAMAQGPDAGRALPSESAFGLRRRGPQGPAFTRGEP